VKLPALVFTVFHLRTAQSRLFGPKLSKGHDRALAVMYPLAYFLFNRRAAAPGVAPYVMRPAAVTLTDSRPTLDFMRLTKVLFAFPAQWLDEDRGFDVVFFAARRAA